MRSQHHCLGSLRASSNNQQISIAIRDTSPVQSTVIIGAGIMGLSTAYYLSESGNTKPDTIHLIEASPELFASASGKAAGFVAGDWFGPATASLGALSFRLHQELAEKHNGHANWGYSPSTGTSFVPSSPIRGHNREERRANKKAKEARKKAENRRMAEMKENRGREDTYRQR